MTARNFKDVGNIIDDMYAEYEKERKENEKKMAKEKEIHFKDVGNIIDDMYAEYEKERKENEKKMAKEKEIHCDLIDGLRYILSLSTDDAIDPKYPIELIWKNSRIQLYRSRTLKGDLRDRVTFEFNPGAIKESDECILRNAPEVNPAINVTHVWELMRENRAPLCIVSFWMDEIKNITKADD